MNYCASISLLIVFFQPLFSQNIQESSGVDSLFQSDKILRIEIRANFSALMDNRTEDADYQEGGVLVHHITDEKSKEFSLKIKPRGNFRLNPKNCDFPPLLINFDKDEVPGTVFDNQNKIKLVTPCQTEEDVLEEYLIYKMYNLVTEYSLQVRLCEILYYDTGRDKKVFEKYSFFIEDIDHLAERKGGEEIDKYVTAFDLNEEVYKKLSVFQYMIGNKDWYETTRHNIYLIEPEDTTEFLIPVPYDFDFSGLIDAGYTKPKGIPDERLESRRVYKGLCYEENEFEALFTYFNALRPEFESLIMDMDLISKFSRKRNVKYIEDFYKIINNDQLVKENILSTCMTRKDYFKFED